MLFGIALATPKPSLSAGTNVRAKLVAIARNLIGVLVVVVASHSVFGTASASVMYKWEGTCTERFYGGGSNRVDLGCLSFSAVISMPDEYEPGTSFLFDTVSQPTFYFQWIGDDQPFGGFGGEALVFGTLPSDTGYGEFSVNCSGGCGRFWANTPGFPDGWGVNVEIGLSAPVPAFGYVIRGSDSKFTRIAEPPSLHLLLLSLAAFMILSRRSTSTS